MKFTVQIKEIATGKVVEYHDDFEPWEGEYDHPWTGLEYMWSEGNYACDCNRELYFNRSQGIEIHACSTRCGESRYRCKITIDETGEVILDELKDLVDNQIVVP